MGSTSQACNSDSDILAALQTVKIVAGIPLRHRLDGDKLPMFSVGVGSGKGFVAIWSPVGLSSELSP